ncbi:MAG: cysteine desulfurase [Phycisphaeraceae bacterium]|nr:MAG: cysteine desulfurase [Phycisphaeraceae bacterium]
MIELDHNATTRPTSAVRRAVQDALESTWHNPSSLHRGGQLARHTLELARASLASLLHAHPRDLTLTASGTEAIDLAIRGSLNAARKKSHTTPTLLTSHAEHAAVRDLAHALDRQGLANARYAAVSRSGLVDLDDLRRLANGASLISIQWVNNETGVIQPVADIARVARAAGALFHGDATQWVGKMPTDTADPALPFDLLTFAPHKFHGPKGVGVLWARRGVPLAPTILGTQEASRRGGTENLPGIAGAGVAAREALAWLADPQHRLDLERLRNRLESLVLAACPGAVVNGLDAPRIWNTSSIAFPRLEAEAILIALSEAGLNASAGAACSSGSLEPSPVLLAMGIPRELAHGTVRFSLSRETSPQDIDDAAGIIARVVNRLRDSMAGLAG